MIAINKISSSEYKPWLVNPFFGIPLNFVTGGILHRSLNRPFLLDGKVSAHLSMYQGVQLGISCVSMSAPPRQGLKAAGCETYQGLGFKGFPHRLLAYRMDLLCKGVATATSSGFT